MTIFKTLKKAREAAEKRGPDVIAVKVFNNGRSIYAIRREPECSKVYL